MIAVTLATTLTELSVKQIISGKQHEAPQVGLTKHIVYVKKPDRCSNQAGYHEETGLLPANIPARVNQSLRVSLRVCLVFPDSLAVCNLCSF